MNYVIMKKRPEIGQKGFIVGNNFVPINNGSFLPQKGLVFYESFNNEKDISDSGHSILIRNNVEYKKEENISCAYFNGNSKINYNWENISGNNPSSISFFMKGKSYGDCDGLLWWGSWEANKLRAITYKYEENLLIAEGGDEFGNGGVSTTDNDGNPIWMHICVIFNSGNGSDKMRYQIYKNGIINYDYNRNAIINTSLTNILNIGYNGSGGNYSNYKGFLSHLRIYNRVLTQEEIFNLSKELRCNN